MSSRFNIVSKPKKIETEEETELEEENTENQTSSINNSSNSSKNEDAKKRMMKIMFVITGGFIILLVILAICSLFIKKTYSYDEIEAILKEAAISYFEDHQESLPTEDGDIVEIETANLVVAEKMKELTEYTGEGVACTGTVQVEKSGSEYLYTPYLDCGEEYTTQKLHDYITNKEDIITSGYGLYNINGTYIYRGEEVNNYVELDKAVWRILKITPNNNIVLIKEDAIQIPAPWDDRYNQQVNYTSGINTYSASRMKEQLKALYKTAEDDENAFLSKNDKTKLVFFNLCTGKRGATETSNLDDVECKTVEKNQKIGLATVADYMSASIDADCKTPSSPTCQNYNYLIKDFDWWTVTADSANTYQSYVIKERGLVESINTGNYASIRPVVQLNSKVLYKSGKGTAENPYKIK